ncbi:MAG: DivIVA domain-containing protein [Bacteroidota bacterium]
MITPIEIRQQSFKKALRGFDKDEVQAFLQALSQEWEQQLAEQRALKEELERIKASYATLKEVEDMLHKTLMQAEQSARDTLENARQKAELKIREAEVRSREIVRKGQDDRNLLLREVEELTQRRNQILTQLQIFLKTQISHVNGYEMAELPAPKSNPTQPPPPPQQQPSKLPPPSQEDNLFGAKENGKANSRLFDDIMNEL